MNMNNIITHMLSIFFNHLLILVFLSFRIYYPASRVSKARKVRVYHAELKGMGLMKGDHECLKKNFKKTYFVIKNI